MLKKYTVKNLSEYISLANTTKEGGGRSCIGASQKENVVLQDLPRDHRLDAATAR